MAQIITSVCDVCLPEGEQSEPEKSIPFEIDGDKFLLELCAEHFRTWFRPHEIALKDAATPRGRNGKVMARPAAKRTKIETETCGIDGCLKILKAGDARSKVQHIRQGHPDKYPEWKARWDAEKADAVA